MEAEATLGVAATTEFFQTMPPAETVSADRHYSGKMAIGAPSARPSSLMSAFVLVTVGAITAGFVASAVTAGAYITAGGYGLAGFRGASDGGGGGGGDGDVAVGPTERGSLDEDEGEELAKRLMIRPADEGGLGDARGSGPPTEPFGDIVERGEVVGRRARWSIRRDRPALVTKVESTAAHPNDNYVDAAVKSSDLNATYAGVNLTLA